MDTRKLKDLAVNESGLIFDPSTGDVFTSNATGVSIISSLKEGKDMGEVKRDVCALYDVDDETAEKDIFDFLGRLGNCGLIREYGPLRESV
jgi:hypothetical protein